MCTALFYEACESPLDTALFLDDPGIDINAVDGNGNSVLHWLFAYANHAIRFNTPASNVPRRLLE